MHFWGGGARADGIALLPRGMASWGRGVDRASAAQSAYPGALCLDGLDVQAVLHGLASAAGLGVVLGAPAGLGAGLAVPILPEQGGAEVHIVALLLGDVSVWAVHRLHVLPEGAGVRVPLGAAWNLADVGFLGREEASHMRQEGRPRRGALRVVFMPVLPQSWRHPCWEALDPSMEPHSTGLACRLFLKVSMWLTRPSVPPPQTGDTDQSLWREGTQCLA